MKSNSFWEESRFKWDINSGYISEKNYLRNYNIMTIILNFLPINLPFNYYDAVTMNN